jgi:hypothetical protein
MGTDTLLHLAVQVMVALAAAMDGERALRRCRHLIRRSRSGRGSVRAPGLGIKVPLLLDQHSSGPLLARFTHIAGGATPRLKHRRFDHLAVGHSYTSLRTGATL